MAQYFIDANGNYYETLTDVKAPPGTVSVPQRPGPWHTWSGSAWEEGAAPLPPVPESVSAFQAKAALMLYRQAQNVDLLAITETVVAGSDAMTKLAWKEALTFKRNSPTIAGLASNPALNLTSNDLDALFRLAATIAV